MSTAEELQAARATSTYKAGIWAFRAMLAVIPVQFAVAAAGLGSRRDLIWYELAIGVFGCSGYILLDRVGVRIFGLAEGIWGRRKMVYRDVFGLKPRGAS